MTLNLSMELDGAFLLCIGGGKAQAQKLLHLFSILAQQGPAQAPLKIRILSPQISPELEALLARVEEICGPGKVELDIERRPYQDTDLEAPGLNLVYAFTDNPNLNGEIAQACRYRKILVNAAGQTGSGTVTSPASTVLENASKSSFLLSVASLSGPSETRGKNPRAARKILAELSDKFSKSSNTAMNSYLPNPPPNRPPYLPFMLGLQKVIVFAGERGEGLQKVEKLALYAQELVLVPENPPATWASTAPEAPLRGTELVFEPGPVRWVAENLAFTKERRVRVLEHTASWYLARPWRIRGLLRGVDYVCSDLLSRPNNEALHRICHKKHIRHTVVDTKDLSDTWFMSLVDSGPLVAGISSRGNCAFYSKKLREELEQDFAQRAPLAQALGELRSALPRKNRSTVLEAAWNDPLFRTLARSNPEAAVKRGMELDIQSKGAS